MKTLIAVLFAFSALGLSQVQTIAPTSNPDFAGDGSAHAAGTGTARQVAICAVKGSTGTVRIGDSQVSATRGFPLTASSSGDACGTYLETSGAGDPGGQIRPARWDLTKIYYFATVGSTVSISYIQ